MAVATALLGVLADGPDHGYGLKQAYDQRFPSSRPLAYSQVYAALAALEKRGEIEQVEVGQDGGPERTVYAITDEGHRALDAWLREPETATYGADELVRKTLTSLHRDGDAGTFLDHQRAVHLDAMRELRRRIAETDDLPARIALDHSLAHLDADLRWLETSRHRVTERTSR